MSLNPLRYTHVFCSITSFALLYEKNPLEEELNHHHKKKKTILCFYFLLIPAYSCLWCNVWNIWAPLVFVCLFTMNRLLYSSFPQLLWIKAYAKWINVN